MVCGLEDLVQRVKAQAVERHTIHFPPTWVDARRESQLLLAGQPEPERPSATGGGVPGGVAGLLQDRGIYIERVENLHLHLTQGPRRTFRPERKPHLQLRMTAARSNWAAHRGENV